MARNLLQLVQQLSPRLGFRPPTLAITSQDLLVNILVAAFQEEGEELAGAHEWSVLTVEYTVPALATQQQTAFPTDFDRLLERAEIWDRSLNMRYLGPTDPHVWDELKSGQISAGYVGWWRIIGGRLQLFPTPTAGHTLAFEYIQNTWAQSAGGTPQTSFLLDTDLPRLGERLFMAGARWRFKQARGLDYGEDMNTYERMKELDASNDRGLRMIRKTTANRRRDQLPTPTWPGTITA